MIIGHMVKKYWIALTAVVLAGITIFSLMPLDALPEIPSSDKTHHFIAYTVLAFPTAFRRPYRWIFLLIAFVGYSGVIELLQPFVNRYGEWLDLLANTSGVVCGACTAALINRFFNLRTKNN